MNTMVRELWKAGIRVEACEDAKEVQKWVEKIDNIVKSTARGQGKRRLEWLIEDELIMDEGSGRTMIRDTDGLLRYADTV
jgi:hypothetical protein